MATPSEVIEKYSPVGEIDVHELGGTVSWADLERDTSCWLGNTMQWAYYTSVRRLESIVKETEDEEFLRLWRYFQTSDHLYYMFTSGGGPGRVHSYFSHFELPGDAYVTAQSAILDFENRIRLVSIAANEPFLFYTGKGEKHYTGTMVWTLKGFIKALRTVKLESLEFHNRHKHFEQWMKSSLKCNKLAKELENIRHSKLKGEKLRREIIKTAKERYKKLKEQIQATKYF